MISKDRATQLKQLQRRPIWHGEDFAASVVRMDREITAAAQDGVDGTSMCFNPIHVPALIAILKEHGFVLAHKNAQDSFRVDVQW